jgi:hypothetical protein
VGFSVLESAQLCLCGVAFFGCNVSLRPSGYGKCLLKTHINNQQNTKQTPLIVPFIDIQKRKKDYIG